MLVDRLSRRLRLADGAGVIVPNQTYTIDLDYDPRKADASLSAFRARILAQLTDLASRQSKIELFKDLQGDSKKADDALQLIKTRSEELRVSLGKLSKDDVSIKQLSTEIKAVDKDFKAAEKSANAVADRIKLLDVDLKKAGIDTANLAGEQLALAAAFAKVQAAAQVQTARGVLGVTGADEARAQIAKLTEAYNVLRKSGTLSVAELTQAKTALNTKIREVQASMDGATRSSANLGTNLLAISAGSVAIGTQLVTAAKAAIAFEQGIARISSISNFTVSQLEALKRQVLELTQRIGIDAPTALAALYEILSAGIPEQNAFKVLESSSKAAIAGVTDINTAAKIGVAVLNSYGLQVSQLDSVYDKLFVTVRDGVTTFPELAQNLGPVLPAARLAGVGLGEVSAAMVVLTRAGIPTAEAATAIENAIKQLSAPTVEAAQTLRDLGIEYNGLSGTVEQFAKKNLSLDVLKTIIPDARGLRAVASLTQNFALLREEQDALGKSSGETKKAFDKLANTPEQQIKKLTSSIETLRIAIGEGLLKNTLGFINAASEMLRGVNELDKGVVALSATLGAAGLAGGLAVAASRGSALLPLLGSIAAGIAGVGAAALGGFALGDKLAAELPRVKVFGDALGAFLGFAVTSAKENVNLLTASIQGNTKEQERARAALAANSEQYREYEQVTQAARLQIAALEQQQKSLTASLDAARNAAISQTAAYATALSPLITAVDDAFNKVTARVNQAETSIKNFQARLGQAQDANKQLLENNLASIDATLNASIEALNRALARREITEIDAVAKSALINTQANAKTLAALAQFSAESIAIVDKENAARVALVKKSNGDEAALLAKANIENRQAKIAVLDALRDRYKVYVDGLIAEELRFLDKVKELGEKRREFNLSVDEKIRELGRGGLDEYQARNDRLLEIDENLFKARAALNAGNTKQAEEFAKRAIELAGQTATAVKGAKGEEVSKDEAIATAQRSILASRELINAAIDKESESAKAAATAYTRQREVAQAELGKIKAELEAITAAQSGEVKLRITADTKGIDEEITKLRKGIEEQAAIQKVKLSLEEVTRYIATLKKSIEDGLDGVIVRADLKNLKTDVDAAVKALPGVNIKVDDAELKALDLAFTALDTKAKEFTKVKVTVESNVKAIAAEITDLGKLDTKSKHTVVVTYVTEDGKPAQVVPVTPPTQKFATGGSVSVPSGWRSTDIGRAVIAKFANGGSVGKVPGIGNSDTVLANLRQGDFILRKRPSELLELLASQNAYQRGRGIGGDPSKPNDLTRLRGIGGDPSSPNYLTRLRGLNPTDAGASAGAGGIDNSPVTTSADQDLIAKVKAAPVFGRAGLLDALMNATVNAELAWLKKARTLYGPNGVDPAAEYNTTVQSRAFAQAIDRDYANAVSSRDSNSAENITTHVVTSADTAFKTLAGLKVKDRFDGFAAGGEAGGNIPALLTPGELHFDAAAVRSIGIQNLMALNAANSRDDVMKRLRAFAVGGLVDSSLPPMPTFGDRFAASSLGQSIARFNAGGAVSNSTSNANSTNNVTFSPTVTINAASDVNIKQTVRALLPEFKESLRREGISLTGKR